MTDTDILKLYFKRDEKAVAETGLKYGQFLLSISFNILKIREDSEECVNDTYIKAWDSIPPQRPQMFKNWLGRTVRNISINLWNKNHALKRYQGLDAIFDELEECIPSKDSVYSSMEEKELTAIINRWLYSLEKEERRLFIKRYWYGEEIKNLAKEKGTAPSKISKKLFSLRQKLKNELSKEGYTL